MVLAYFCVLKALKNLPICVNDEKMVRFSLASAPIQNLTSAALKQILFSVQVKLAKAANTRKNCLCKPGARIAYENFREIIEISCADTN